MPARYTLMTCCFFFFDYFPSFSIFISSILFSFIFFSIMPLLFSFFAEAIL